LEWSAAIKQYAKASCFDEADDLVSTELPFGHGCLIETTLLKFIHHRGRDLAGSPTLAWDGVTEAQSDHAAAARQDLQGFAQVGNDCANAEGTNITASARARRAYRWHSHEVALDQLECVHCWKESRGAVEALQSTHWTEA
jgi:hypothetical protein